MDHELFQLLNFAIVNTQNLDGNPMHGKARGYIRTLCIVNQFTTKNCGNVLYT